MKTPDMIKALEIPANEKPAERKATQQKTADAAFDQQLAAYYPYPHGQRDLNPAGPSDARKVTATEQGSSRERKRRED